jgi:RNA methyltransferase, TrmH family
MPNPITSSGNPLVKRIKRLRQRKYRQAEGAYFVEGLRVVLTAVEQNAPVESLIYAPELLTSDVARRVVAEQEEQGVTVVALAAALFRTISERDNPTGLGAIVRSHWSDLDALPLKPDAVLVALVDVADPGNLGTILRTLDATAAAALILVGRTTEPFQAAVARASMGALYTVPVGYLADEPALLAWARQRGLYTIATSARAPESYWTAAYHLPALLIMGSEGEGLRPETLAAGQVAVSIPMSGSASSLNLALATALILYELQRRTSLLPKRRPSDRV